MNNRKRRIPFDKEPIKKVMKAKGITQEELAEALGMSWDWIKGVFRDGEILPTHLAQINAVLGIGTAEAERHNTSDSIPMEWIFDYADNVDLHERYAIEIMIARYFIEEHRKWIMRK